MADEDKQLSGDDIREKHGSKRPSPEDFGSWNAYWTGQGMPWRTEPEIDEKRQSYLAQRRTFTVEAEKGMYPFREIKLSRADVEWLLATHDDGSGHRGPVDWQGEHRWRPDGPDLRGAVLCDVDLNRLPLTRLLASLRFKEWINATSQQREAAALHLERCTLFETSLEGANLRGAHFEAAELDSTHMRGARLQGAHFEGARLWFTHLEETRLEEAHFEGRLLNHEDDIHVSSQSSHFPEYLGPANLRFVFFDGATHLDDICLGGSRFGWVSVSSVQWGGANLSVIEWSKVRMLGEERVARQARDGGGRRKPSSTRLTEYRTAVRAYRQLAVVLRGQGVNEDADRFAYRAQLLQRQVLRRQGHRGRVFGSWLLDLISGYGYKPMRSVITYLLVILSFAAAYFALTNFALTPFLPSHSSHLAWYEAIVLSISSFHGRGLFPSGLSLGDPVAILAAFEAIIGLLIEITFIATFTQRFFAR